MVKEVQKTYSLLFQCTRNLRNLILYFFLNVFVFSNLMRHLFNINKNMIIVNLNTNEIKSHCVR